jgi:transcriptional regulator with PAS, ATPase and Fis domain
MEAGMPDGEDEGATEITGGVPAAIRRWHLAEHQRRLAIVEGGAPRPAQRFERLRGALSEQYRFENLIGQALAFRGMLDQAARVAPEETTVLL